MTEEDSSGKNDVTIYTYGAPRTFPNIRTSAVRRPTISSPLSNARMAFRTKRFPLRSYSYVRQQARPVFGKTRMPLSRIFKSNGPSKKDDLCSNYRGAMMPSTTHTHTYSRDGDALPVHTVQVYGYLRHRGKKPRPSRPFNSSAFLSLSARGTAACALR